MTNISLHWLQGIFETVPKAFSHSRGPQLSVQCGTEGVGHRGSVVGLLLVASICYHC